MSIVLWCTTVFIAVVWLLLYVINGAQYWNCSLVALLVPEVCFWPAKLRKNLNSLRCMQVLDLVLNCYSDKKEVLLIHFISLHCVADQNGIISWLNGKIFFIPGSIFRLNFSRISVLRKGSRLDSKTELTKNGLTWSFVVGLCLNLRHICMD